MECTIDQSAIATKPKGRSRERHTQYMREYRQRYHKKFSGESHNNAKGEFSFAVLTQDEVAREMGITRQAVHQTERRAIVKLRQRLGPNWRAIVRSWLEDITQ